MPVSLKYLTLAEPQSRVLKKIIYNIFPFNSFSSYFNKSFVSNSCTLRTRFHRFLPQIFTGCSISPVAIPLFVKHNRLFKHPAFSNINTFRANLISNNTVPIQWPIQDFLTKWKVFSTIYMQGFAMMIFPNPNKSIMLRKYTFKNLVL